ncbi:MAG: flagellar hook assembly protein FlgD [Syntrophales bacterium]
MIDASNTVKNASATNSASQTSTAETASSLGKDEFFKMLIAQLKNQDPLNPQDGAEFSAQLAQFSSLEQLTNLNKTLEAQGASYNALMNLQSVSMVGKEVEAKIVDKDTAESKTVTGTVSAVQFKDSSIFLTVNDQEVSLGDVVSVK